jgi:hypothetical protein
MGAKDFGYVVMSGSKRFCGRPQLRFADTDNPAYMLCISP